MMKVSNFQKIKAVFSIVTLVMVTAMPFVAAKMSSVYFAERNLTLSVALTSLNASLMGDLERDARALDEAGQAKLLSLHGFSDLEALVAKKNADIAKAKSMTEELKPVAETLSTYGWPSFWFCGLTLMLMVLFLDFKSAVLPLLPGKKKDGGVNDAVSVA